MEHRSFSFCLFTLSYCANDDDGDTHTGRVDLNENASGEWAAAFTNYSASPPDFSVKDSSSALYNAGTSLAGTVDVDIIDTARPQASTYDIGAVEYVAPAGGGVSGKGWMRKIGRGIGSGIRSGF